MDWKARARQLYEARGSMATRDELEELALHAEAVHEAGGDAETFLAASVGDLPRPARRSGVMRLLDDTSRDLRFGLRLLRRQRGFTFAVVLTLALASATAITLFSVTYGVLLKPLPWPEADRLIRVEESRGPNHGRIPWTISNATYNAWRDRPQTIEALASWFAVTRMTLAGAGDAERVDVTRVTPSLFSLLRARPAAGRLFDERDASGQSGSASGPGAVIISDGLWRARFGGDGGIVGRVIRLDDRPYSIVGVMPRQFVFPDARTGVWMAQNVAQALGTTPKGEQVIRASLSQALARLRPGATAAQAAAEATARGQSAPDLRNAGVALFGSAGSVKVVAESALDVQTAACTAGASHSDGGRGPTLHHGGGECRRRAARARGHAAQRNRDPRRDWRRRRTVDAPVDDRESVAWNRRAALPASCLPCSMRRALMSWLPADFPRAEGIELNGPVVVFAIATAVLSSVACAVIPVWQVRRISLLELLTEDNGTPVSGGAHSRVARTRAFIMAAQIAAACVLLVGAGLLARTFLNLRHADRGYDPSGLLTARLPIPASYPAVSRAQLMEALHERMSALPGVQGAAFTNGLPLVTPGGLLALELRPTSGPARSVGTTWSVVSPDYLNAMRMRVVAGRGLTSEDAEDTVPAVVVNRTFAANVGNDVVGRHLQSFTLGGKSDWEIVGVVDDVQQGGVTAAAQAPVSASDERQPEMYFSYRQIPDQISADPFVIIRASQDPASYVPILEDALREQDPSLVFDSVATMDDRIDASLATPRLYAVLIALFGGCALIIAVSGLFGVLSYIVAHRTKEIGVRTALGATPGDVLRLVLRQGMMPAAVGLLAGVMASMVLAGSLANLLYGVSAHDAATFVAVPAGLFLVALAACAIPANRAARLDPLRALRSR